MRLLGFLSTTAVVLSIVLLSSAQAQTRLPSQSRSERQVEDINRNIQQDRRLKSLEQELEVRDNQLRQDIDRNRMFANPPIGAPSYGRCPPGAIRC